MTEEITPAKVRLSDLLGPPPRWWHCDTHGGGTHTAWGCPDCVRELRALAKEQAVEIERLRSALRGLLALDEDHSQRGGDDDDVCAEVQAARAALGPKRGTV